MTVNELSRKQLIELKQNHLADTLAEINCTPSYGDLADVDNVFPDSEIFTIYEGVNFTDDDFACSCH